VAEFAIALPAVVAVLVLAMAALGAGARQIQLQDAAADAARLAARGESPERAAALVATAVRGAQTTIDRRDDLVCVTATAVAAPAFLGAVRATACALDGGR